MIGLTLILFAIALVDSTSMIPIGLFPLAAILGGRQPVIGALSFISGIFLVYTLSGVLLLLGFDLVFEIIGPSISRWWNQPNIAELGLQIVVGTLLLVYPVYLTQKAIAEVSCFTASMFDPGVIFCCETTVCGLSSSQHQNQLNFEEKANYLR